MKTEIQIFKNPVFGEIRTIVHEDGTFDVIAKDVAERLDYAWQPNVISNVPNEWKGIKRINTPGGEQEMLTLTEQGLYFFLARSDKPLALPFQKWIAGEVLPSIRRTGTYSVASVSHLEDVIEYLKDEVHLLKQQRAAFHAKEGSLPLQFAVKKLRDQGIWKGNEYELVNWMILNRIIQRHKTKRQHFVVYQKYFNKGYFDWGTLETDEPMPLLKSEIFITAKGMNWLTEMFAALTQKRDEPLLEHANQRRNQRLPRELTLSGGHQ